MKVLFASEVSKELDDKQQNLLHTMIREATQVKVDSLVKSLNDGRLSSTKKLYILDCLKVIDKHEARVAIAKFADKRSASAASASAQEIAAEAAPVIIPRELVPAPELVFAALSASCRNPYEYNAEYIRIPGGRYNYQDEGEKDASFVYFAKYPVTNKRYRHFIRYLEGKEAELLEILPKDRFDELMTELISPIKGFGEYLRSDAKSWADKLRSAADTDKRLKGDDQPVVGVSWFVARTYCFWLSVLEETGGDSGSGGAGGLYRLPTGIEWQWAASGGKRTYPWGDNEPNEKLANYDRNVGATTPVGRYPEGATPESLMDMGGNVWEWMEDWPAEHAGEARCLRGGSWFYPGFYLRCSSRNYSGPEYRLYYVGFRVVRSQS